MSERYLENHMVTAAANPIRWLTYHTANTTDIGHLFGYGLHSYVSPLLRHRVSGMDAYMNVPTLQKFDSAVVSGAPDTVYGHVFPEPANGVLTVEQEELDHYHEMHPYAKEALIYASRKAVLVAVSESSSRLFKPDPTDPSKYAAGVRLKAHSATHVAPALVARDGQVIPPALGVGRWEKTVPANEWWHWHPELNLFKP